MVKTHRTLAEGRETFTCSGASRCSPPPPLLLRLRLRLLLLRLRIQTTASWLRTCARNSGGTQNDQEFISGVVVLLASLLVCDQLLLARYFSRLPCSSLFISLSLM